MANRDQLLALAARCEAASGPDPDFGSEILRHMPDELWAKGGDPTASLDAALSLAQPPGSPLWTWTVKGRESPDHPVYFAEITKPSSEYQGRGRTPALALTAAWLRARAALA